MVNNFDRIRELLDFTNSDTYYFIQILKRRKDNPEMAKDMVVIDDIFIYNSTHFDVMKDQIIKTCNTNNARAYFRINKRSAKKSAFQMLKRVADLIMSEDYKAVRGAFSSVSGEFHGDDDKKWIIDVDWKDFEGRKAFLDVMHHRIKELQEETGRDPMMEIIPTKNGYHLITRPFNIQKISQFLTDNKAKVDIHKDNPTILYCP
jgi:hypothetical protein